jgi:hypothetical protein
VIFRLAMGEENAAVGRARSAERYGTRRVVIRPRGDGEEEEHEKEEEGEMLEPSTLHIGRGWDE